MKNGRPESYREIVALKNAHMIEKYIAVTDPQLIPDVFQFLMASPSNVVKLNRGFMSFVDYKGEILRVLPIIAMQKIDLIKIKRDGISIRTPGSSSMGGSSSGSSNNNNNNNNHNNNNG